MKVELEIETKPKTNILERKGNSTTDIFNLDEVQAIKNAIQEHFLFIGMDRGNNIRSIRLLGIGSCSEINIDSKDIVRTALLTASEKVVLVHNHPSNSLQPTKQDLYITNYTNKILEIFNIQMVDHIIVTEKDFRSMGKYNEINRDFKNERISFVENIFLNEENQKLKEEIKNLKEKSVKNKQKYDR